MNDWEYNEQTDSWLIGDQNNGCGVFQEGGEWTANVVVGVGDIVNLGSFASKRLAMAAAIKEWEEMQDIEGYIS